MPQFPSLPDPASLMDLLVAFPENSRPLLTYINAVMRGDGALSVADRELIAAYVSGLNACAFCHDSHAIYARLFGIPDGVINALLDNLETAPVSDQMRTLLAYVGKLNTLPAKMVPADAQKAIAAGNTEAMLFEAIEVAGVFNLMNRLIEGAGVNFDYKAPENAGAVPSDPKVMENSYLNFADRIEAAIKS